MSNEEPSDIKNLKEKLKNEMLQKLRNSPLRAPSRMGYEEG